MNKKLLSVITMSLVVLFLAGALGAFAQEISEEALAKEGLSLEELQTMTTYYYKNPQPDKMLSVLKVILSQDSLIKNSSHFYPLAHLFATVAHNDSAFLDKLKSLEADLEGAKKGAVQTIIKDALNFESPKPITPVNLDALWAEFIATGDITPVKKIISVLGYPNTGMSMLLIGAAEWSLASNAQQHDLVRALIQKELTTAQGSIKERLEKIIQEVGK